MVKVSESKCTVFRGKEYDVGIRQTKNKIEAKAFI